MREINDVLRRMPDSRRRAFLLHKVEKLSIAEVARKLKIGKTTAYKHILRATRDIDLHLAAERDNQV
ncbi:MAG: sigma-70 region 4 domain-containing protein [Pseudomonadota bacterium]